MDILLWNHDEYARLYNCSMYKVDDLPMENRQKTFLGILILILFFIAEALYVPCFVAIWRNMKESCYKIMFVLGLTDLCALWVCAFETGIFAILGSVFCSFPTLVYISGMIGNATFAMETALTTILAVNRCFLVAAPKFEVFFFDGWRTFAWLSGALLYSCWFGLLHIPVVFSSLAFAWSYNPHYGYIDYAVGESFLNKLGIIHDLIVTCAIIGAYGFFLAYLLFKNMFFKSETQPGSNKMIFLQVFLISLVNIVTCLCYVSMGFFSVPKWIYYLSTFMWTFCHGIPPIIYLTMNRTIRAECAKMFYSLMFRHKEQTNPIIKVHPAAVILGRGQPILSIPISSVSNSSHPTH